MQEDARRELVRLQAAMLEAEVEVEVELEAEVEVEVEVEEVVEEQQLKKKRFKSNPVTKLKVILENEDAIVEWAAIHPELYDRGHSDYFSCHFNDDVSIVGCLFYNVYVCPGCLKC